MLLVRCVLSNMNNGSYRIFCTRTSGTKQVSEEWEVELEKVAQHLSLHAKTLTSSWRVHGYHEWNEQRCSCEEGCSAPLGSLDPASFRRKQPLMQWRN